VRRLRPLPASGARFSREPTGRANARPMTGSTKQSMARQIEDGLLRRFTPVRKRFAFVAGNDTGVVPAKAGTHTPRRSFERRCSMTFAQQLRAVAMGPGSRFACPGRQRWIFDSIFKQPIAFSRRECARGLQIHSAQNRGRRECRALNAPAASHAKIKKHTSIVTTVTPGSPGIPRAMVLTVSFVISPVTGLCCHRRQRKYFRQLDASVGASEPHDFAVRLTCCSSKAPSASTASRPAFVTIASRPFGGTRRRD
jgi:hypothetical protein